MLPFYPFFWIELAHLQIYDNSLSVARSEPLPDPVHVAEFVRGRLVRPAAHDVAQLRRTPDWAKPVLAAALERK